MDADDDFTRAPIFVRQAEFSVFWSAPLGTYSMGYASLERAMEAFDGLKRSLSVRSASLWHGQDQLAHHDLDPYAWHDVRMMVGR